MREYLLPHLYLATKLEALSCYLQQGLAPAPALQSSYEASGLKLLVYAALSCYLLSSYEARGLKLLPSRGISACLRTPARLRFEKQVSAVAPQVCGTQI